MNTAPKTDAELQRLLALEGNDFSEQVDAYVAQDLIKEVLSHRRARGITIRDECPCRACHARRDQDAVDAGADPVLVGLQSQRFVVCVFCGNKRCPHATDHEHDCTNSNEPGQPGSVYS